MITAETLVERQGHVRQVMDASTGQIRIGLHGLDAAAEALVDAYFAGENVSMIGEAGIAKTTMAKNLAEIIVTEPGDAYPIMTRFQGVAERQPADLLGAEVYDQKTHEYGIKRGPVFAHILLADELNRNNTKTAAALHEAMEEGQVTLKDGQPELLPDDFTLIATMNDSQPGEATIKLPKALADRLGVSILFEAPSISELVAIGKGFAKGDSTKREKTIAIADLVEMRKIVNTVVVGERDIALAARAIAALRENRHVQLATGGPRAMQSAIRIAQAHALRSGATTSAEDMRHALIHSLPHRIDSIDEDAFTPADDKVQLVVDTLKQLKAA